MALTCKLPSLAGTCTLSLGIGLTLVDASSRSTELLLGKGYEVHGIIRRSSSFNTGRLHHLYAVSLHRVCRLCYALKLTPRPPLRP